MRAVFLDYATVSYGDLDPSGLLKVLPALELFDSTSELELRARLVGAEVVLTNKLRLTEELLSAARALKLIGLSATGTNNIDLVAARRLGIGVCNVRDYCTPSVVQHVLGAILSLTHHLPAYHRLATDGTWGASRQFSVRGGVIRELAGRVLGVVGLGSLGRAVSQAAASALGMRVLVSRRPGSDDTRPERLPLDALLEQADVLSLHCPLTDATRGLIGARELSLMKPDALLINTARGALVDGHALADALRAGRLGGAAIDVLPEEPPIHGSPLFAPDLENLLVTPHIAWAARESRQRCLDELATNVREFLSGGLRGRVV